MKQGGNNFAFIDSQNLNLAIRGQGWMLDFRKFFIYLQEKYQVRKAFLFIGYIVAQQPLYNFLGQCGYTLIFKPTLHLPNGGTKGNVDAELVLHTMIQYANFDQAIIVSGDGDFYCLVDYLRRQNKLKKLLIPDAYCYSGFLKPFAPNQVHFMNNLRTTLAYKKSHN